MNDWEEKQIGPAEISASEISEAQLHEVILSYIIPEGSDLAMSQEAYDAKERLAQKQIATGSLKIIYDAASDTTTLMSAQDWRNFQSK